MEGTIARNALRILVSVENINASAKRETLEFLAVTLARSRDFLLKISESADFEVALSSALSQPVDSGMAKTAADVMAAVVSSLVAGDEKGPPLSRVLEYLTDTSMPRNNSVEILSCLITLINISGEKREWETAAAILNALYLIMGLSQDVVTRSKEELVIVLASLVPAV